jgi:hypothetical protein
MITPNCSHHAAFVQFSNETMDKCRATPRKAFVRASGDSIASHKRKRMSAFAGLLCDVGVPIEQAEMKSALV